MSVSEIFNIILAVVAAVLTCFECRSSIKNIIVSTANEAINFAENKNLSSSEKMDKAIGFVESKLPAVFKPFVTKEFIRKIIQAAFDKVAKFVSTQDYKNKN